MLNADSSILDDAGRWRVLYQTQDLRQARMISTCIAAMEYDVRLIPDDRDLEHQEDRLDASPFSVEVHEPDWPHLVEVLDELITEQEQFDDFLDRWRNTATSADRRLLVAMIIIVASLAVVGAIEL